MASGIPEYASIPFSDAIKVVTRTTQTSAAACIGSVPNGGYVALCMLAAASAHLSRNQPDALTARFEYPARTSPGPAVIIIEDVKLGRSQPFQYFGGFSLPTGYESTPAAALPDPAPHFDALKARGKDAGWEEAVLPQASGVIHSLRNWHFYLPRSGPLTGVLGMWIRPETPELRELLMPPSRDRGHKTSSDGADEMSRAEDRDEDGQTEARASLWFRTVVMNLEVKAALPGEGAEWLNVRATSKQIKDGRFDLEILVRDVDAIILGMIIINLVMSGVILALNFALDGTIAYLIHRTLGVLDSAAHSQNKSSNLSLSYFL
ncbi:thioesterase family protein [Xylaria bambusicola]|uniref:thioesterase family protein n=1 Tax=Xylaria bambusicola TaxID=326684 RepID=UPI002007BD9D|nr:thioesterase family protein [Xylaria bambusicola]KAI0512981.1 thioesterase family protein [Xylaria bambusicola]